MQRRHDGFRLLVTRSRLAIARASLDNPDMTPDALRAASRLAAIESSVVVMKLSAEDDVSAWAMVVASLDFYPPNVDYPPRTTAG